MSGLTAFMARDAALYMACEKSHEASLLIMDVMHGIDVPVDDIHALLFEALDALVFAVPHELDRPSLTRIMTRSGLVATIPGTPVKEHLPASAS